VLIYGWTNGFVGTDEQVESKHSLSEILGDRSNVVFRYALGSVSPTPSRNGFSVDSVRIGNGTRSVLIENFTNTGIPSSNPVLRDSVINANTKFREFNMNGDELGVDVVKIDYHVSFPGEDPFNLDNPIDPGARALYYGISTLPNTRLDGKTYSEPSSYFTEWGDKEFSKRVLDLANADIQVSSSVVEGQMNIAVSFTPTLDLPGTTVLHVAVVEREINADQNGDRLGGRIQTGESEFKYVLKKMLPNAAGTKYTGLQKGVPITRNGLIYANVPLFMPENDLSIVVFLQDEMTKTIYQSVILHTNQDPAVVVGIEDLNAAFKVFPNPADQEITLELPFMPTDLTPVTVFDQMGKAVSETSVEKGEVRKTIDTSTLAAGMYIIQVDSSNGILRRKVIVVHKN
jgi:hypothetical protein